MVRFIGSGFELWDLKPGDVLEVVRHQREAHLGFGKYISRRNGKTYQINLYMDYRHYEDYGRSHIIDFIKLLRD